MDANWDDKIIEYKNLERGEFALLPKEQTWKKNNRSWGDAAHKFCSYVAMFSPSLANFFISNYSDKNDIVMDTFSGRGTTVLESRLLDRRIYAMDLNPLAYVISKSKSESFNLNEVLERVKYWERKYNLSRQNWIKKINPILRIYYSEENLKQLSFIKEKLGLKYKSLIPIDNFILSLVLGLMHGPMRKNGKTIYFSLGMSNHTSMSPTYVKNYAIKHGLQKPKDNVFEKICNRAEHVLKKTHFNKNKAEVKLGNALEVRNYFNFTPKLVFTSPPYLNLINYTKQNWIKMWMLGFENEEDNKKIGLDDRHKLNDYEVFIKKYLVEVSKMADSTTSIILVIGDINHNKNKVSSNYFELIWEKLQNKIPLVLTEIYTDKINPNRKATSSLGSKSGRATRLDKIYVFKLKQ